MPVVRGLCHRSGEQPRRLARRRWLALGASRAAIPWRLRGFDPVRSSPTSLDQHGTSGPSRRPSLVRRPVHATRRSSSRRRSRRRPPATAPATPAPPRRRRPAPSSPPVAPSAPAPVVVVGETTERDIVVETARVEATFSNRGGDPRELAAQGLPRLAGPADGSGAVGLTAAGPHAVLADGRGRGAERSAELGALASASSGDRQLDTQTGTFVLRLSRRRRRLRCVKRFALRARGPAVPACVSRPTWSIGGQRQRVDGALGAGLGDIGVASRARASGSLGNYVSRRRRSSTATARSTRIAGDARRRSRRSEGHVPLRRRRRPLLPRGGRCRAGSRRASSTAPLADARTAGGRSRQFVDYARPQPPATSRCTFFVGPEGLRRAASGRSASSSARSTSACSRCLVVPLLSALKWINGFVGNYGWSIIVLTILINIVMFPLRHKSVVSMRKMQADPAADEGDPGSLRATQDDRSRRGRR